MRKIRKASAISFAVAAVSSLISLGVVQAAGRSDPAAADPRLLIYSYDEMFEFDIENYLASTAPHLLPHAETISHWAGYTTISPKVLIALMEQQSTIVSLRNPSATAESRPFGNLSRKVGFAQQVQDVAHQLATAMYANPQPSSGVNEFGEAATRANPLEALLSSSATDGNGQEAAVNAATALDDAVVGFTSVYSRLFGEEFRGRAKAQKSSKGGSSAGGSSASASFAGPSFLQFPFSGRWHVGGAHSNTGSGYPLSSLDMSVGGGWGSNQSGNWVRASAAGSFKRHSSCFAEVVHSGGWSTTYYHLMNITYGTGASVSSGAAIGNPANTRAQALCNGGSSTGPHQHWGLKSNGSYYSLNQVTVSGYTITATGGNYDTNCNRFYLTKNGYKYCSGFFNN